MTSYIMHLGPEFKKCITARIYFHYSETSRLNQELLVITEILLPNTYYCISKHVRVETFKLRVQRVSSGL